MTAPAAPLEKAVANARRYFSPMSDQRTHTVLERDVLALLAALDADRGEAEAALREIRDSPTAMGKDIARRYFARREEKGENHG